MICDVCHSARLTKNDLGFLVCDDCGAQSFASTQEESEFILGGRSLHLARNNIVKNIVPIDEAAPMSLILEAIQATLFVQCCAVSEHFGVQRKLLLQTAGNIFLAYFENARRDYDDKFEIILFKPRIVPAVTSSHLPKLKVQHFFTVYILALALNVIGEPMTPLDLYIQIRFGTIPTTDIPRRLPSQISSRLTVRLFQFLSQRIHWLSPSLITKGMKKVYEGVVRVVSLPSIRPVSGNVSLTITRFVLQLQLPTERVASLAHALLVLFMRKSAIDRPHAIAVVILAVKLLFGSRSPSPLDSIISRSSFVPVSRLCAAPDPDAASLDAVKGFIQVFIDLRMHSSKTQNAVSDAFDDLFAVPPPEEEWDVSDFCVSAAYDDIAIRDDEQCLCWYKDPVHGGTKHTPINLKRQHFLDSGGYLPDVPEYRRLVFYEPDAMHLGHCIEHYFHRRIFQIASDIFSVSQRELDDAYRRVVVSIYRQYSLRLAEYPIIRRKKDPSESESDSVA